jgi:hypothetical protein
MNKGRKIPISNLSNAVEFLLKGAKKRRSLAMAKAKMIQGELGVIPRLISIK